MQQRESGGRAVPTLRENLSASERLVHRIKGYHLPFRVNREFQTVLNPHSIFYIKDP
jgi:hypothetical protein